MAFKRNDDGTVELARVVKEQVSAMDCSDTWTRGLEKKHRRRDRAIRRLRTSATEADSQWKVEWDRAIRTAFIQQGG